jgi:GDP-6-deoxy-D-talose 4-dehydrogenase
MKVLVTGSSGFLGFHLLNELSNTDLDILALYNKRNPKNLKSKNIRYLKKNIKYLNSIEVIKKFKPNILIHLAWKDIPNFSLKKSEENLKLSKNFINEIIKIKSVKKIIVTGSSFEENTNSHNYYFVKAKKSLREWLFLKCKRKKIDFGWLRVCYVYGAKQRKNSLIPYLIDSLKNKTRPTIKNLNNFNDFIYVEDVSKIIVRLINKKLKSKTFYIGTGRLNSVRQISHLVEKSLNKKNIYFKKGARSRKINSIKQDNEIKTKKLNFENFKFTSLNYGIKKMILYN